MYYREINGLGQVGCRTFEWDRGGYCAQIALVFTTCIAQFIPKWNELRKIELLQKVQQFKTIKLSDYFDGFFQFVPKWN